MKRLPLLASVLIASLATMGCTKKDEPASTTTNQTSQTTTTSQPTTNNSTSPASTAPVASSAPISQPSVTSQTNVSSTTTTTTVTATTNSNNKGETLYQNSCRVCHDTGNLGSPRMGDKAAWKDRIAQGNEVLYSHAINGFTGKTGTMPPKGTSNAPDSEIKQAVDYMVSKSK